MRDQLPKKQYRRECGINNLDIHRGTGTNWVDYRKINNDAEYFQSFGNLQPPIEVLNYLGNDVTYNFQFNIYRGVFNSDITMLYFNTNALLNFFMIWQYQHIIQSLNFYHGEVNEQETFGNYSKILPKFSVGGRSKSSKKLMNFIEKSCLVMKLISG